MKKILICNDLCVTSNAAIELNTATLNILGYDADILPTSLFSTNLAFKDVIKEDTSQFLSETLKIFKKLNIKYDAIYLGYLVNETNIKSISNYASNSKIYFDPILGDNDKYYKGIDNNYTKQILPLIQKSYLITPNLFEAKMILGQDLSPKETLKSLAELGPQIVVLTGVYESGLYGAYLYDKNKEEIYFYGKNKIEYFPHGTGDIFSALLMGLLEKKYPTFEALKITIEIIYKIIKNNSLSNQNLLMGLDYLTILKEEINKL